MLLFLANWSLEACAWAQETRELSSPFPKKQDRPLVKPDAELHWCGCSKIIWNPRGTDIRLEQRKTREFQKHNPINCYLKMHWMFSFHLVTRTNLCSRVAGSSLTGLLGPHSWSRRVDGLYREPCEDSHKTNTHPFWLSRGSSRHATWTAERPTTCSWSPYLHWGIHISEAAFITCQEFRLPEPLHCFSIIEGLMFPLTF